MYKRNRKKLSLGMDSNFSLLKIWKHTYPYMKVYSFNIGSHSARDSEQVKHNRSNKEVIRHEIELFFLFTEFLYCKDFQKMWYSKSKSMKNSIYKNDEDMPLRILNFKSVPQSLIFWWKLLIANILTLSFSLFVHIIYSI